MGMLQVVQPDNLYLVGDIIDGDRLRRKHYWPQGHENVLKTIQAKAKSGTRVVFVPGNHDEGLRTHLESHGIHMDDTTSELRDPSTGIILKQRDIHVGGDGRRHLVTHGDRGDANIHSRFGRQLAVIGDVTMEALAWGNRHYNQARNALGMAYQPLDGYFKRKFQHGKYMTLFRQHVNEEAAGHGVDGVICGHVHVPEISTLSTALEYKNCGDMVASVSALVESRDGRFTKLDWAPLFNAYQWGCQQQVANPSEAFENLAVHHGAVAQQIPANERFNLLSHPAPRGNVTSAFVHLIDAARLDCGEKSYARRIKAGASQMSVPSRR